MKATGIVRRIDDLGRIVIPEEIRRTLHIREGDPLELFLDNDGLYLQKYFTLGALKDEYFRIATTMAEKSNLHPIAIYDTAMKLCGGQRFPIFVPDFWEENNEQMFIFYNSYGIYKISNSDGVVGYIACELDDIGCEMEMIAHYLNAVVEN